MRSKRIFGSEKGTKKAKVRADPDKKHRNDNASGKKSSESVNVSAASTPDFIPIPGVTEVSSYWDEQITPFSLPEIYIKQVDDELSYALTRRSANYDMDDEDEEWLSKINAGKGSRSGLSLSDESFELIIDAFEKAFFCSHGEYNMYSQRLGNLCSGLCSEDMAKAVYDYWLKKQKQRKSALVKVFEAHKVKKPRGQRKSSKQMEGQQIATSRNVIPVVDEDTADEHDIMMAAEAAVSSARRLADLAVKKRSRAQLIMTNADLLMYKASMAMRIAEEAQIREALGVFATDLPEENQL
ncbi:unnamed protein product [Rhodiola kirilowii]